MGKKKSKKQQEAGNSSTKLYVGVGSVLIIAIAVIVAMVYMQQDEGTATLSDNVVEEEEQLAYTLGDPSAVTRLVVYSDYGCIHCARLHPHLERLAEEHGSQVKIVLRHYPINNNMPSRKAIAAALAAKNQGKYLEMSQLIYSNPDKWRADPDGALLELAGEAGLDTDQFVQDFNDDELMYNIVREYYAAREQGINSTPSLFLNGDRVPNPGTFEGLVTLIN